MRFFVVASKSSSNDAANLKRGVLYGGGVRMALQ